MNYRIPFDGRDFPLGKTLATEHALGEVTGHVLLTCIQRHQYGDWGLLAGSPIAHTNMRAVGARAGQVWSSHSIAGRILDVVTYLEKKCTVVSFRSRDGIPIVTPLS